MVTRKRKIIWETDTHRAETKHEAQTESKHGATQLFPEKKSRATAAFQGGAFSLFPPGSNCLFSSLLGLWPCCRKVLSAEILVLLSARVSTLSVGEGILPPWFESTAAVKKPAAVVRPVSHVPSFGGHCCPGVSRPVPADGDSSSSSSGSILPRCSPN